MDKKNDVLVFCRPIEEPVVFYEKNIRIFYVDSWIDFRDGEIIITKEVD